MNNFNLNHHIGSLYSTYKTASEIYQYDINVSKKDFTKILNIIYDELKNKINIDEFKKVSESYIYLLIADARDKKNVNINWFIDSVFYLYFSGLDKKIKNKYKGKIINIQNQLIKEFSVEENLKEKVSRKCYTKLMIR